MRRCADAGQQPNRQKIDDNGAEEDEQALQQPFHGESRFGGLAVKGQNKTAFPG
jgi:hypothetical protein